MKKSVMKKWVAALRSGKYKQGQTRLKNGDKYCCLGVLCDISKQGKWLDDGAYETKEAKSDGFLPNPLVKWAGMKGMDGRIEFKNRWISLTNLNDSRNRSFKHIAAFIERNYKRL